MRWQRTRTVLFGDDDSSGLIYFPSNFHYMSEGDQEDFAAIVFPVHEQVSSRVTSPTVHVECDYLAPARAGDVLTQDVHLLVGQRTSVTSEHEFLKGEVLVARGRIVRAFVDLDTMSSCDVPAAFRAAVTRARHRRLVADASLPDREPGGDDGDSCPRR